MGMSARLRVPSHLVRRRTGGDRITVTSPTPSGHPLTNREREVLQHAALGMTNRHIGETLGIAEQTVKNHLASAMRKLSIHDRTQAVVIALGNGWIALPIADGVAIELPYSANAKAVL
jgi:DNA-binding NarL/FixJ family response regulator